MMRLKLVTTLVTTLAVIMTAVVVVPALDADEWGTDDDWGSDDWGSDDWGSATLPGLDLSGYLETTGLAVLPRKPQDQDRTDAGLQTLLRLRGRFEPRSFLSVTVETEFLDQRGVAAAGAAAGAAGAENRRISFDYLYGSAAFGPVDLRVGRQPLAWGTAYALNPTDLMNPATMEGLAGVEPPGIAAVSTSFTAGERFAAESYLGFEDRSRHPSATAALTRPKHLPWGVRGRAFLGLWDLGAGFVRSVERVAGEGSTVRNDHYLVAEVAGSAGEILLYGEAAVELGTRDWHLERSVDGAAGARWEPLDTVGLQAEYHRRGRGSRDPEEYAIEDRLARRLMGRDYLVGIATLSIMEDDLQLVVASVFNLNDRSASVLPEFTWRVTDDFQTSLGGALSLGPRESEFDGRIHDGEHGDVDLGRPVAFMRATWYF